MMHVTTIVMIATIGRMTIVRTTTGRQIMMNNHHPKALILIRVPPTMRMIMTSANRAASNARHARVALNGTTELSAPSEANVLNEPNEPNAPSGTIAR